MPKKLVIWAALVLLLCGCGASSESAPAAGPTVSESAQSFRQETSSAAEPAVKSNGTVNEAKEHYDQTESFYTPEEAPAQVQPSEADYFTITRPELISVEENGVTVLYEKACGSTFSSADPERMQWVNEILDTIQSEFAANSANLYKYAQDFLELNGSEYFYSYSNYQELGIARHDESLVSILSLSSLYSGGVHPNAVQSAYNLDLQNHRVLRLEDVIEESGAETLITQVKHQIREKFQDLGEQALFDDYQQTIDQSLLYGNMTPYWYFNDTGLVIFYNQYELGPYAAGIIKVELPYGELEGILRREFYPSQSSGTPGNLVLRGDWEGYRKIPITIESEGERLLVGVEGMIFQIQLSEIYWLEQTPIMQEILFSAASMSQNDVLEIQGGFTDDGRSFAIEFLDGAGEQKVYYLHAEGLTEQP